MLASRARTAFVAVAQSVIARVLTERFAASWEVNTRRHEGQRQQPRRRHLRKTWGALFGKTFSLWYSQRKWEREARFLGPWGPTTQRCVCAGVRVRLPSSPAMCACLAGLSRAASRRGPAAGRGGDAPRGAASPREPTEIAAAAARGAAERTARRFFVQCELSAM